jgi:hypothetical protein
MLSPLPEQVNSISNEITQSPEIPSTESNPAETGGSSLKGELGAEKMPTPVPVPQPAKDDDKSTPIKPIKKSEHIVDKTAGKIKLHPVSPQADSLTTIADKDEEDFIEGVETAHHANK